MDAERTGQQLLPVAGMAAPMAARLRAYWQALRVGDALPRRDQFAPRELAPLLGALLLIDRTERGAARLAIAGRVLTALYGMELRGAPLSLLFEPAQRADMARQVDAICDNPATLDLTLLSEGDGLARPRLAARMMLLPLSNRRGLRDMAIGTIEVCGGLPGDYGLTPRRFTLERSLRAPLGLEPPPTDSPPPPPRGKPVLRLVK